ncbi:putative F-box/kelch-repeat protein At5g24040 [Brassica rapa]|uniref:KIB1-4 beta-propeller domain-containing protein n=1 Tax=Brassica campestris TaxID=3711 RepID=M4D174_BRACM|nr:putative F-box/kelch-repeat protein At5g24040 [Brassica rapa]
MSGWSELPPEIIHMISLRIDNPFDLIHFRSVCSWWRSCSLQTFRPIPSLRCPLPPDAGGCGDDCHILRSRVYLVTSLSHDPPRFWLFKLQEEENGALALQSLLNRRTSSEWGVSYPSLLIDLLNSQVVELVQEHVACYTYWCDLFDGPAGSYKCEQPIGFMRLDGENKEFMALGRLSFQGLGMYRSFEDRWTEIETTSGPFPDGITWFNGQFYVIDTVGVTKVVKPTLEVSSFRRSRPCNKTRKRWFVKAEDKLLLVEMCTRNLEEYRRPHLLAEKGWFEVSELNEERNDWIQMEDVGGRVLFLDDHFSLSCLPNQVPGFKPNSIIFKGVLGYYGHQVFEFGEQGFILLGDIPEYTQLFPSPSWIVSNV